MRMPSSATQAGRSGAFRSSVPGLAVVALLPAQLAEQGRRRGPRAVRAAGAPGDGLRRAGRAAAGHRAVHLDPLPARLRGVRAVAHPGARSRLLAGADDRGDDRAAGAGRRRPGPGGRAGLVARAARRARHDGGRPGALRLRRRPAVEADPDRLHERAGADHRGRPAAQAVRVLGRRRRPHRRDQGLRHRAGGRRRERDGGRARASARWSGSCCCSGCCPRLPAVLVVVVVAALAVNVLDLAGATA